MVWQVLQSPSFETRDISSVQSIGYGGAPAAPELVRRIEQLFPGRTPSNGYGLTETSSVTTMNSGVDYQRKPDSVGVPVPVVDVRVVDADGNDVPRRRGRRALDPGPERREGLLGHARGDRADLRRRLVEERRPRPRRRRGLRLHRRPRQGHGDPRRRERVLRRGRGRAVRASRRRRRRRSSACRTRCSARRSARSSCRAGLDGHRRRRCARTSRARLAAFKVPAHVYFRDEPLPRNPAGKVLKRELRDELVG